MPRVALDSNILIYAEGGDDAVKQQRVAAIVPAIGRNNLVLPVQAAGETLRWLLRKARLDMDAAAERMSWWFAQAELAATSVSAFHSAVSLAGKHKLQIWDAVIMAASAEANARVLLSEDMQHGFFWEGIVVMNPFKLSKAELNELLQIKTLH
jgi:predicted nucleic acid-binding protein